VTVDAGYIQILLLVGASGASLPFPDIPGHAITFRAILVRNPRLLLDAQCEMRNGNEYGTSVRARRDYVRCASKNIKCIESFYTRAYGLSIFFQFAVKAVDSELIERESNVSCARKPE